MPTDPPPTQTKSSKRGSEYHGVVGAPGRQTALTPQDTPELAWGLRMADAMTWIDEGYGLDLSKRLEGRWRTTGGKPLGRRAVNKWLGQQATTSLPLIAVDRPKDRKGHTRARTTKLEYRITPTGRAWQRANFAYFIQAREIFDPASSLGTACVIPEGKIEVGPEGLEPVSPMTPPVVPSAVPSEHDLRAWGTCVLQGFSLKHRLASPPRRDLDPDVWKPTMGRHGSTRWTMEQGAVTIDLTAEHIFFRVAQTYGPEPWALLGRCYRKAEQFAKVIEERWGIEMMRGVLQDSTTIEVPNEEMAHLLKMIPGLTVKVTDLVTGLGVGADRSVFGGEMTFTPPEAYEMTLNAGVNAARAATVAEEAHARIADLQEQIRGILDLQRGILEAMVNEGEIDVAELTRRMRKG